MREIVLDTETTGLDPKAGHRIVEIGCVELKNRFPTGRTFHHYINPQRDMPIEAQRVHGLSGEFLKDKPVFAQILAPFLEFIEGAPLVIHNAEFDMRFLNHELSTHGHDVLPSTRAVDTLMLARSKFPGTSNSLDALCKRFAIDNAHRQFHGALLDAHLLALVYAELTGGRQQDLIRGHAPAHEAIIVADRPARPARTFPVASAEQEQKAHEAFLATIKDPLWADDAA